MLITGNKTEHSHITCQSEARKLLSFHFKNNILENILIGAEEHASYKLGNSFLLLLNQLRKKTSTFTLRHSFIPGFICF